jgi:hypothetical protein
MRDNLLQAVMDGIALSWDSGFGVSDSPDVVIFDGMAFERISSS